MDEISPKITRMPVLITVRESSHVSDSVKAGPLMPTHRLHFEARVKNLTNARHPLISDASRVHLHSIQLRPPLANQLETYDKCNIAIYQLIMPQRLFQLNNWQDQKTLAYVTA